jgi:ABC-type molybdate transport system substrate-binding protein
MIARVVLALVAATMSAQAIAAETIQLYAAGSLRSALTEAAAAFEAASGQKNADQQVVALPAELAVGADYGLTVLDGTVPAAYQLAMFILSTNGQRILAKHGFAAPALPQ